METEAGPAIVYKRDVLPRKGISIRSPKWLRKLTKKRGKITSTSTESSTTDDENMQMSPDSSSSSSSSTYKGKGKGAASWQFQAGAGKSRTPLSAVQDAQKPQRMTKDQVSKLIRERRGKTTRCISFGFYYSHYRRYFDVILSNRAHLHRVSG